MSNIKKITFIASTLLTLIIVLPVFAANNNEAGAQNSNSGQQINLSPSPTGNQVKNVNQVKTQNEGEESQLQVNTQEQESYGEEENEKSQIRNQFVTSNMINVSEHVQKLLQIKTSDETSEQIKNIAQDQIQSQTQIQEHIYKIESKGSLSKSLFGPDFVAIKNLKQQIEQNQLRVIHLEQLQNKLLNQGDITIVQETIQSLIDENTSLQDMINMEEQVKSLFGWLLKLFIK